MAWLRRFMTIWIAPCALVVLLLGACSGSDTSPSVGAAATSPATGTVASANQASPATTPASGQVAAVSPTAADTTPRASAEVIATPDPVRPAATVAAQTSPTPATTQAPRPIALHPFQPANGRQRVVVLDPGHGGEEVGSFGAGVVEKDANLQIARRLRTLLEQDGYRVVLVRDCDCRALPPAGFEPPADWRPARVDLQARLDIANLAGGDIYLSIHNNGNGDPRQSGTEVWWDGRRPFAAYNEALATELQRALVANLRAAGYPTIDRGAQEDTNWRIFQGRSFPIFVLGPPRTGAATTRAANMPAALGEALFLSNPAEAPWLTRPAILDTIARAYRDATTRYFARVDSGALALPPGGLPPETPNFVDIQPPNPSNPGETPGR
ncbi:MAG: N-acetylmuramoyl-L-alanine amidase [Chloroflexi bacterium]|nr:N-acetylmuramoyl-L-alanine amidase [Chloroflexota bacterium]